MAPQAETGAHDAGEHRLADQELLRALAGLVVIVDQPIIRRLEAVEFLHFAADGQRGEQHVVAAVGGRGLFFAGVEHFEGVAGLHLALEIDVVGVDADQVFDDRARDPVAQSGFVDALVEANAGRVVLVVAVFGIFGDLGVDVPHVDRNIFAGIRERDDSVDRRFTGDNHADRL